MLGHRDRRGTTIGIRSSGSATYVTRYCFDTDAYPLPMPVVSPLVQPASTQACAPRPVAIATARELVSCVMPTRDRRRFALQSVRYFLRQDFPTRELLVLDDGSDDLYRDLPSDPRIRYVRVPFGESIGAKRNRGCALAYGSIIAQWDDDDWYAPDRLSAQVAPLLANRAEITGLTDPVFLDLAGGQAWRASQTAYGRRGVASRGGCLVGPRSANSTRCRRVRGKGPDPVAFDPGGWGPAVA